MKVMLDLSLSNTPIVCMIFEFTTSLYICNNSYYNKRNSRKRALLRSFSDDSNKYQENACMFMALRSDALNKTIYQASSSFQLAKRGLQVRQNMPMYPQEYRLQRIFPHITKRMEAV